MRSLLVPVLALVVAGPLGAQRAIKEPSSYEQALAQYEEYRQLQALWLHSLTWARLARTEDLRALPILIREHENARNPKQVRRHLLSAIATRTFVKDDAVDQLAAWREDNTKPEDAWLWYRTLSVDARNRGPETSLAILRNKKSSLTQRAAALEALGWCKEPEGLYTGVEETVKNLPKKPYEKALLAGAMGSALERHRGKVATKEFKIGCSYFLHLLDDEYELETSTKLVVARHLGRILDTDEIVINAAPWIARLGDQKPGGTTTDDLGYVRPTFFGVQATGSRICYVIDMSDSMCMPVEVPEELRNGPISGGGEKDARDEIPWHLVKTRFDLAREQIKLSLRNLDKDALFAVVYFGDEAGLLDSCKGMSKASKGAIKKVIKELDSIEQKEATPQRPHGRLRGQTNLHGGLRSAFRVKKKGLLEEHSYIDLGTFAEGADTIFLLSDGDPSWDDYPQADKAVGEAPFGDPESGQKSEEGANQNYSGPYRWTELLLEDVERLNLFREVEIHCVSIGKDATRSMLDRIAEIGHGSVLVLGN